MKRHALTALLNLMLTLPLWAQQPVVRWQTVHPGSGAEAKRGNTIAISYVLRLADGRIIEASPEDTHFRFQIGSQDVIPGLSQGVLGMQRGETRDLVIPPALGYGANQVGAIAANSVLHFQVKLHFFVTDSAETNLALRFGKDGTANRPDAGTLQKPAMFEYLIRDFFTRPWRYADSPRLVWQANGVLAGLWLLGLGLARWRESGAQKGDPQS